MLLGVPVLSEILKQKDTKTNIWDFAGGKFKIIWTPRWTTDVSLGGSNFFTYKDVLTDYAFSNSDTGFIFRPHPLALDNFVKSKEMTSDEVEDFRKICNDTDNLYLDESKDYIATFWNSDAMITDISGVLPEYFVTEKPIIYCATNMVLIPAEHTKKLFEGCYIANDWEEVKNYIDKLKNGEDPLREKRLKIINDLWGGDSLMNCTENIKRELLSNVNRKI